MSDSFLAQARTFWAYTLSRSKNDGLLPMAAVSVVGNDRVTNHFFEVFDHY